MTNREQINEIMGKIFDLPQRPVFYEDDYPYPWKPFKSNGGTGDGHEFEPSTTVIPEPEPIPPKLCPFRKRIYCMAHNEHTGEFNTYLENTEFMEEAFLPCLQKQCARWNERLGECKY